MTPLKNSLWGATNVDPVYSFVTDGTNNGRIHSMTNVITGETVTYQYDVINRLASATSNDPPPPGTAFSAWGQSFTYEGFGDLTGQAVTKGSTPQMVSLSELFGIDRQHYLA